MAQQRVQMYRLYLAARPTRGIEGAVMGFLLVRAFNASGRNWPVAVSLWPTRRVYQGKECIYPEIRRLASTEMKDVRALMVLDDSASPDTFVTELPVMVLNTQAHVSPQYMVWSHKVFTQLARANGFDQGPLTWSTISNLMRATIGFPQPPIPTYDLRGQRIDSCTLPPPQTRTARVDVDVGPANPNREKYLRRHPPSPVMSEAGWSTRCDIGTGRKYHVYSPPPVEPESSFAQQQGLYIHRTTTHHRSSLEKENLDVQKLRRQTRPVPEPEPQPKVVSNAPLHREVKRPKGILKQKPYARPEGAEQTRLGSYTPQRVGMDLHARHYDYAEPERVHEHTSRSERRERRSRAHAFQEEMYAWAEKEAKRHISGVY